MGIPHNWPTSIYAWLTADDERTSIGFFNNLMITTKPQFDSIVHGYWGILNMSTIGPHVTILMQHTIQTQNTPGNRLLRVIEHCLTHK